MSIDEAIEIIKKYNACIHEEPRECFSKKCEECEYKHSEEDLYQIFNLLQQWLEDLKYYKKKDQKFIQLSFMEFEGIYNKGRADAIEECVKIVKFHETEYDGICWAIRELEELKEKDQ